MQGILSGRAAAIAVVLLLIAGFLLTRYLGRRMGDARRGARADVNRILGDLAAAMGGRFEEGGVLSDHPLLGRVRVYGTAHVKRPPFAIAVSVSYPADDLRDDRTTVHVQRPADRRWRVATLHQRAATSAVIDGSEALPGEAREALLRLGARTSSLDLRDDALEVVAAADGDTVYMADVARLRGFVEEVTRLAEALLAPPA